MNITAREGRIEREIDRHNGAALATMPGNIQNLQAAKISLLRRVSGLSLGDRVRSSAIWEGLSSPPHPN